MLAWQKWLNAQLNKLSLMKLNSLSVKKLLRAIATPAVFVSTLLSGSLAMAGTVYVADGINLEDFNSSERFFHSVKGPYLDWNDLQDKYEKTGNLDFLGNLAQYVKPNAAGKIDLTDYNCRKEFSEDTNMCWAHAASDVITYWQTYYGVFYKGEKELPYGINYDRSLLTDTNNGEFTQVVTEFVTNWTDDGGNAVYGYEWYFNGGLPQGYPEGEGWSQLENADSGGYGAGYGVQMEWHSKPEEWWSTGNLSREELLGVVAEAFGYTKNGDKWEKNGENRICSVGVGGDIAHALTCLGFGTDDNGELEYLIFIDNDGLHSEGVTKVYLKKGQYYIDTESWLLYYDKECTKPYADCMVTLDCLEWIETPEVLKNKYAAYSSADAVLVWNGKRTDGKWTAAEYTLDHLPTEQSGWKVYAVDDYYNAYYQSGRHVSFDDAADVTDVNVSGKFAVGNWVVDNTVKPYSFTGSAGTELSVDSFSKTGTEKVSLNGLTITSSGACTVESGTLAVGDCSLRFDSVTLAADTTFSITAPTAMTVANVLTMKTGSSLDFTLGEDGVMLTFSGTLSADSVIALTVDGAHAEAGKVYQLVSFAGSTIGGTDMFACSQGVLTLADDTLCLTYYAGGYLVWDSGDGVWSANQWESEEQLTTLSGLTFAGLGEGTETRINIVGDVNPAEMSFNPSGIIVLGGEGRITGTSRLVMKGSGELRIEGSHTYSGGTVLEAGSLKVGSADSLGSGKVTLKGGMLNLNGCAVSNSVEVQGDVVIEQAENYRGGLSLVKGSVVGSTINLKQTLELREGSIANNLTGSAGFSKLGTGKVVLSGENSFTGASSVTSGTLEVSSSGALGCGDILLNGGTLALTEGVVLQNQKLTMNGGNVVGTLALGEDAVIDSLTASTINGNLELDGGTLVFHEKLLTVTGDLVIGIGGTTTLDISCWSEQGTYRVMRVGNVIGDLSDLKLYTTGRNNCRVTRSASYVQITLASDPATLYWTAENGVWKTRGGEEWAAAPGENLADPRFHTEDSVVFAQGGTVTIEGNVRPDSVLVSGTDALILDGSGSIGGKASLRKTDSGRLVMNASNDYTGGTIIDDGEVVATGEKSFGSKDIRLNGGTLELADYAVQNDIYATGGALSATAYEGNMVVSGDLSLGAETRAKSIRLNRGSLSGMAGVARAAVKAASIVDTPIEAAKGRIDVDLLGTTSLKVTQDEVILSGRNNSYTGGTTVQKGTLTVEEGSSLGTGTISLMGGILKAAGGISLADGQQMQMQGGSFAGSLKTNVGSSLSVIAGSSMSGSLTLNGGNVTLQYPVGSGTLPGLAIDGELAVTHTTSITLSGNYVKDSVLMTFDSMSGSVEQLVLLNESGKPEEDLQLSVRENSIVLSLGETLAPSEPGTPANPTWNYDAAELNDMLAQTTWGTFHASHAFMDAIRGEKYSGTPIGQGVSFWVSAVQSFSSVDSSGLNKGADATHSGGAVGLEMLVGSRSCVGMAAGMLYGEVQTEGSQTEMDQDSVHIGVYGATRLYGTEKSALTLSVYLAYGTYESTPTAQYASGMTWEQDAVQVNTRLDWSTSVSDTLSVNLFGGLEYFAASEDEVDGLSSGDLTNVRAEIGAGVTKLVGRAGFHAEARLLGDVVRDNPAPTVDGIRGDSANPGRIGLGLSAGAVYNITPEWSVNANANAEFMDGASSCSVNVGTAIRF